MKQINYDVLVIVAGITGLIADRLFTQKNYSVIVITRSQMKSNASFYPLKNDQEVFYTVYFNWLTDNIKINLLKDQFFILSFIYSAHSGIKISSYAKIIYCKNEKVQFSNSPPYILKKKQSSILYRILLLLQQTGSYYRKDFQKIY